MTAEDLRKSILQQAIQGKLVPQDPNDEPAAVLLERIREEKARLVKEKKIKKDKNESIIFRGDDNSYYEKILTTGEVKCIDDEIPFEIPESWEWVRFKYVADIARGGSPRPIKSYITDDPNGVNWIKIGDTEKGSKYINTVKEKIKQEGVVNSRMVYKGDFLLTNSMSFGRPYITNVQGCIHDGWLVISPCANTYDQDFLFYLLSSAFAYNQFSGKVSGAVVKNLNTDKVLDAIIPLPPIEEQKRIALKVERFFPLIEQYQHAYEQAVELEDTLNERLRKSILQYAIQGKLVPQIDTEEPATILLEKIRAEKLQLLKEGKLKKKDIQDSVIFKDDDNRYYEKVGNEMVCIDDELPFDIPQTWTWVNIGSLFYIQTGAAFKKEQANTMSKGVRILRGGNISPDHYSFKDDDIFIDESLVEKSILLQKNDLITPAVTSLENIGKMARVLEDYNDVSAGGFVFILRPHLNNGVHSQYLCAAIQSPYLTNKIKSITKKSGSAFYNIGKERLVKLYLPLPPLAEQSRIVNALNSVLKSIEG